MVHELHKLGFQRLRIVPGMSPSGMNWRVNVTPISNILRSHGAMAREFSRLSANYTSAMDNAYFDWEDARNDTARELADKFLTRYPEIVEAARGQDWEYAGWYVEMLGAAERGALPISYADWNGQPPLGRLQTTSYDVMIPAPPPGEADEPDPE
jgi:hypothetical protein